MLLAWSNRAGGYIHVYTHTVNGYDNGPFSHPGLTVLVVLSMAP